MASAKALEMINAGINPDATAQRERVSGVSVIGLTQADIRLLLTIQAARMGDQAVMSGTRLQQLGRAESVLNELASADGIPPLEMLHRLRETSGVSQEIFDAVAAGKVDPAEALAKPGPVETALKLNAQDQADAQAAAQLSAAEQAIASLPDAALAKFAETIKSFGSPDDTEPGLTVLAAATQLSKSGQYAVASALLQLD